jgi:hypothetical protein
MLVNAMLIKCMPTDATATVDFKLGPRMALRVCIFALNILNRVGIQVGTYVCMNYPTY